MIAFYAEDFRKVLEENPLPPSFIVNFSSDFLSEKNINSIISEIEKIKGVSEVVYDYSTIVRILKFLDSIKYLIYVVSALLILLAIYLVYINNQTQIRANTNLYNAIKLVGAKINAIKIPIMINSIIIGIISGLISFLINTLTLLLLINLFFNYKFSLQNNSLFIICLLEGIIIAFIGNYLASRKLSIQIND